MEQLLGGWQNRDEAVTIPRSYLYVPGDAPEKLAKALTREADAVIIDLEDAVPPAAKDSARDAVRGWLADQPVAGPGRPQLWVRLNPGTLGHEDARAVVGAALTGVMAAKTESAADLAALDGVLTEAESAAGLSAGAIRLVPLLESGSAVLRAGEIAAGPRVDRLQLGEADLTADLGITAGPDERELDHLRSQIVLVSAAARIGPPVAPVSTNFRDLEALRSSTRALARRGFLGRACIHPAQVQVVNEVFTPTAEEVEAARDLITRFDEAAAAGRGVVVSAAGRMVDEAVVRQARRVLHLVDR